MAHIGSSPRYRANLEKRRSAATKILSPLGMSKRGINRLVKGKSLTASEITKRLGRMRRANVPITGLGKKLGFTRPQFGKLIRRYAQRGGLTETQYQLHKFLIGKGVSRETASKLASTKDRQIDLGAMRAKIAFFESIELDLRVYGVRRIPAKMYEGMLGFPLYRIATLKRIKQKVLYPLEDKQAAKKLDKLLPGWKNSTILTRLRAATVLQNVIAAKAKGIRLTANVVSGFSAKTIESGKAKVRHTLNIRKLVRQLEGYPDSRSENYINARYRVVDHIVARPHLAVDRKWLRKQIMKEHRLSNKQYSDILDDLRTWGIISSKDGFIRISILFRWGGVKGK